MKIGDVSKIYESLMEGWRLPLALMGGTRTMREHSKEFLPRWKLETLEGYNARVKSSTLYNAFKRTVRVLSSKPFHQPVAVVAVPKELEVLEQDVDRQGQTLTQFCRVQLTDQLTFGLCHWLVDMPQFVKGLNRAQAAELNIHPYFCRIRPDSLIYWRFVEGVTGEQILDEIHILREETDGDNDEWIVVTVWTRESIQVWKRKKEATKKEEDVFALHSDNPNMLGEIPLITVYADVTKKGTMQAGSPLEDLAWLNLKHFQSQSDQDMALHYARIPFLHFAGFDADDVNKTIAADNAFVSKNAEASIKWVEPMGTALAQGSKDLEQTEARMDVMGADLMVQKPGNPTATAKSIDTAEKISDLQAMVMSLENGVDRAYYIASKWLNLRADPTAADVQLDTEFGLTLNDAKELDFLLKARLAGEISRELFYQEIQRRGLFEEFDAKEELNRVALEMKSMDDKVPTSDLVD